MPKYKRFREWCLANGVFNPSVDYPVAFGKHGQLVGMCAARDIPPMTAFLYVPWHLLITEENIRRRSPDLNELYDKHPEVFKKHYDAEYLKLIVFLWHERAKGEASFWKPYIDIINFTDLPFLWSDEELAEFQDAVLIANIKRYRVEFEEEWLTVFWTLHRNKYDHIIPGISDYSKKDQFRIDYIWAFCGCVTRCFGWGLPCTLMAPFCDTINHHNVDSSYDVIKAEWRPISCIEHQQRFPHSGLIANASNSAELVSVDATSLPEDLNKGNSEEAQVFKEFDHASGENKHYHTMIKCQTDLRFFYDHFVPNVLSTPHDQLKREPLAVEEQRDDFRLGSMLDTSE